jgi:hypothetical protein
MAEPDRGKSVFQSVVEYPLPKQAGIRDYLFYFVRPTDGYGRGARYFFDKFYPNHVRREAATLESLINTLHTDIVAGGFQQIRELVIVSHGSALGNSIRLMRRTRLRRSSWSHRRRQRERLRRRRTGDHRDECDDLCSACQRD